jgi:hypothetical protein
MSQHSSTQMNQTVMDASHVTGDGWRVRCVPRFLRLVLAGGFMFSEWSAQAQTRESLAGEEAAQALKKSIAAEEYNWSVGPVRLRTEANLRLGYTDNVFFSDADRRADFLVNPEVALRGLWPVTELNTLRLSLGLGYEWYLNNKTLNSDAPLINPDSEMLFHVFVGDFRIRLREKFSYQESLFFNSTAGTVERFFNFTDVGKFTRWDNLAGLEVVWDLNELVLSAGYDHENFMPVTSRFGYMERASEWFTASAAFRLGDQVQVGLEGQGGLHDYEQETTLHDNWRGRGGPFNEHNSEDKISLRAGGGFDTARFDAPAAADGFDDYYAYGRIRQETRLFAHALTASREHLLGDNADNLQLTQVRYSISSPVVKHVEVGAELSVNFAEEFGGAFREEFDYYRAAVGIGYQFHKHWRTGLGYEFFIKNSDLPARDFLRNRVSLYLTFAY